MHQHQLSGRLAYTKGSLLDIHNTPTQIEIPFPWVVSLVVVEVFVVFVLGFGEIEFDVAGADDIQEDEASAPRGY